MDRRNFIERLTIGSGALASTSLMGFTVLGNQKNKRINQQNASEELSADVVIIGGGLGGCATAFAALRNNLTVILTEETDWIGGQITQQGVPPDEHNWIETHGAPLSYREFRSAVREYYKKNYPLTDAAKADQYLNPGAGYVSRLCHEPKVTVSVLQDMMAPYISAGKLVLLLEYKAVGASVKSDEVHLVTVKNLRVNKFLKLKASYFVDATELGELLPITGTEYVTGSESREQTNELHAAEKANPKNNQAFTVCFAIDYVPGEDWTIKKPEKYDFWKEFVPKMKDPWSGKMIGLHYSDPRTLKPKELGFNPNGTETGSLLNLWNYRKIINKDNFVPGFYKGDITIVNWPQNDYVLGDIVEASVEDFNKYVNRAKQQNLSLLYWLQTEAPRADGGKGWPGLRLRKDVMGTDDGMAKYPYIRECRRIKALFTVLEEHLGTENRGKVTGQTIGLKAAEFYDSVGVGYYQIDLHPTCEGDNYVDIASLPYQIPLGALIPQKMKNLLPANKNIGTTHITNGCFREHPTEWGIGEAVGMLVTYALNKKVTPRNVREDKSALKEFQNFIRSQGIETEWKES